MWTPVDPVCWQKIKFLQNVLYLGYLGYIFLSFANIVAVLLGINSKHYTVNKASKSLRNLCILKLN